MPAGFLGRQTPMASQKVPAPQGLVGLQALRHCVALRHWLLPHGIMAGVVHPPVPLQNDAAVSTPAAQLGAVQTAVAP
jgi:hypothetical protein